MNPFIKSNMALGLEDIERLVLRRKWLLSELKKLEEEKQKISQELDEILTQLSDVLVKE